MQHEIMTIQEVSEYLRVSERTVYDWAIKNMIPCGKIGTSWRFKRSEIEKWVDRKLTPEKKPAETTQVSIENILDRERIILFDTSDKHDALTQMIDIIATSPKIRDKQEITQGIFQREKLMSTGIGHGVGVPHIRQESIDDLVIAVGVSKSEIKDYESLDGVPVRIIFMIAAGKNQHTSYIKTLASISRTIKQESIRTKLLKTNDASDIYNILTLKGA